MLTNAMILLICARTMPLARTPSDLMNVIASMDILETDSTALVSCSKVFGVVESTALLRCNKVSRVLSRFAVDLNIYAA